MVDLYKRVCVSSFHSLLEFLHHLPRLVSNDSISKQRKLGTISSVALSSVRAMGALFDTWIPIASSFASRIICSSDFAFALLG